MVSYDRENPITSKKATKDWKNLRHKIDVIGANFLKKAGKAVESTLKSIRERRLEFMENLRNLDSKGFLGEIKNEVVEPDAEEQGVGEKRAKKMERNLRHLKKELYGGKRKTD
jgi:hypothetical protein